MRVGHYGEITYQLHDFAPGMAVEVAFDLALDLYVRKGIVRNVGRNTVAVEMYDGTILRLSPERLIPAAVDNEGDS